MKPQIKIFVMDRGHIKVGWLMPDEHALFPFHHRLCSARVIRVWGTTRGLAQLANEGPTTDTKLDDKHNSNTPWRAVIDIIDVVEDKWTQHLDAPPAAV